DALREGRDCGQHHVSRRHWEVVRVVFADTKEVDTYLLRENALLDDVADRLRMRKGTVDGVVLVVAERVQPEHQWKAGRSASGLARAFRGRGCHACTAVVCMASSNSDLARTAPKMGAPGRRIHPAWRLASRMGSVAGRAWTCMRRGVVAYVW